MKIHTQGYKTNVKTFGRELDSKISYELNGETIELGSEELNSITPHYESSILKSAMKQLDIDSNIEIPLETILTYQLGVKVNGEYEYINYGNYVVYKVEKQEDTNSYKITCYDKMLYSMKDYERIGITYPITIKNYLIAICGHLGLTFNNTHFANEDREIQDELYFDSEGNSLGYTFRDVLDEIAQATGSTICINDNDELEVRYITDASNKKTLSGSTITINQSENAPVSNLKQYGYIKQEGTPTPDNPVDIEVGKGKNIIDFTTIGYGNGNGATTTRDGEEYTVVNGSNEWGLCQFIQSNLKLEPDTTYTFSAKVKSTTATNGSIVLVGGGLSVDGQITGNYAKAGKRSYVTFTTPSTIDESLTSSRLGLYPRQANATAVFTDVMLEKNNVPTNYVPYKAVGISSATKNLLDVSNYVSYNSTVELNETGFNAIASGDTYTSRVVIPIFVKQNQVYNISFNCESTGDALSSYSFVRIRERDSGGDWISNQRQMVVGNNSYTLTPTETGIYYLWFYFNASSSIALNYNVSLTNIQFEKGSTKTDFVPYQTSSVAYKLGDNFLADKDYVENGVLNKKIVKFVLDGSENWGDRPNYTHADRFVVDGFFPNKNKNILCNYFIHTTSLLDTYPYIANNDKQCVINFSEKGTTTLADFKTWLSTHNVEIYCELAETETETLETIGQLETFEGSTTITNDLDSNMEVEYVKEYDEIDEEYLKDVNVNFGEKYGPVNSIVLSRASEADNVYLRDEDSVEQNGLCEIKIKENQIMNFNDRSDYLPELLEKLDGLEYYLNDFTSTGITYYDMCDRYRVKVGDIKYPCIMFNDEIEITQGLQENIHTDLPEESETDYTKADKTDRRINQTYIIANKNTGDITALTQKTTEINDNLNNNYYTITQTNTLVQNAETGVTNTFSEAGGNNVFRNTGLWREQSDTNNPYEFWEGIAVKGSNDQSASHNSIILQNGSFKQSQGVPNGNYAISFMYQKKTPLANASVKINGVSYPLDSLEPKMFYTGEKDINDEYIVPPINVSNGVLSIEFITDINNSVEIYDLMANKGSVKLAWSQNQNETITETVNIGKGITITSSATNTEFRADSRGIKIKNKADQTTTEFTEVGMETKNAKITEEAQICGTLVQEIGQQTWFTRM